jgi:hypothetical protein
MKRRKSGSTSRIVLLRQILFPQLMDLDGAGFHWGAWPNNGLKRFSGEDARAADLDGGDADHVIGNIIEARGLAIERYEFAAVICLKQKPVAAVGQQNRTDLAPKSPRQRRH